MYKRIQVVLGVMLTHGRPIAAAKANRSCSSIKTGSERGLCSLNMDVSHFSGYQALQSNAYAMKVSI